MRLTLFAALLTALPGAFAGTISNPATSIQGLPAGTVYKSISEFDLGGGATAYATACFDPYCGQKAGPGPDFTISDPLTVRLTNVFVSCSVDCTTSNLTALFTFVSPVSASYSMSMAIDGNSTPNYHLITSVYGWDNAGGFAGGNQSIVSSAGGAINSSFDFGTLDVTAGATVNISMAMLFSGSQPFFINMPDSMTVTLVDTSVPEPATLGFVAAGLAALAFARKRR